MALQNEGGMHMPKNILIIDDAPNILLSLEFLMTEAGYEVRTARDGAEAIKEISKEKPDLILLDVMMPLKNGYEVCQEVRTNPKWKDIYIIMLTAKGRDIEKEKGMAFGADDYITKPFANKELVDKVNNVLKAER